MSSRWRSSLLLQVFSLQRVNPSRVQRFVTNSIRAFSVLMVPIAASVPSVSHSPSLIRSLQSSALVQSGGSRVTSGSGSGSDLWRFHVQICWVYKSLSSSLNVLTQVFTFLLLIRLKTHSDKFHQPEIRAAQSFTTQDFMVTATWTRIGVGPSLVQSGVIVDSFLS